MSGGRKIAFDKQHALAAAMHVFWKKGFSGASLADLTTAMGINKPSLYAAFGNKESLFIQHYELSYNICEWKDPNLFRGFSFINQKILDESVTMHQSGAKFITFAKKINVYIPTKIYFMNLTPKAALLIKNFMSLK